MKSLVILGAGQMGLAAYELINVSQYQVIAIGDNDPSKWREADKAPNGKCLRICSIEEALMLEPDLVLIGVMGKDRAIALGQQARKADYQGRILELYELYELLDIRGRTIRMIAGRLSGQGIKGSVAELGVYRGDTAMLINLFFPDRDLYLFDTFTGFDEKDLKEDEKVHKVKGKDLFKDTSVEEVLGKLPYPDKAIVRQGYFPDTSTGLEDVSYAFVSLDPDLYAPLFAGLEYFYPRMNEGGMILVHDYNNGQFPGAKRAVEDYEAKNGRLKIVPMADLHGSCVIIK